MGNNTWRIYLLAFIGFYVSTSEFVIAGILDKIAAWAHISVSTAGQLITVFALANTIGSPLFVMATAKMDRRKLMILALSIVVVGCMMTVTLPGFMFVIVSRIVLAIGGGVFLIIAKSVAAKLAAPGKQADAIGTVITGFSAALIVGVPIGRFVAAAYHWQLIFGGIGILSVLGILMVAFAIPATPSEEAVSFRKQLALLKKPKMMNGFGITFFWQLGYAMLFAYISPFLLTVTTMSGQQVGVALSAFGIAALIGSKLGGFLSDRIGIPRSLVGGMAIHIISLVLLSTVAESIYVAVPLLMLWGFSAWSSGPGVQMNLVLLAPESSGILLGLYGSVLQLSIAAAGGVGGIVARSSMPAVAWAAAVSVAIGAVLVVVSSSRNVRRLSYESD